MFASAVAALIFFFWLIPIFSRLVSMTCSCMVLEPTMKFNWSVVHPGFLAFLRMFKIPDFLFVMVRDTVRSGSKEAFLRFGFSHCFRVFCSFAYFFIC